MRDATPGINGRCLPGRCLPGSQNNSPISQRFRFKSLSERNLTTSKIILKFATNDLSHEYLNITFFSLL